ncbi:MAG: succinate dehydrogenase, cytochrome b556 subunit [Candidatus Zixiibacteriota bacterium]
MAFGNKIKGMAEDVTLNKNVGTFSYWVHRISGIGLSIYLIMHTIVLSSAISGPETFNERMGQVQNPFFAALEILLIAGVFFHMLNGLRITFTDFFDWSASHKKIFWVLIVIFIILMAALIYLQIPKFNPENYTTGGF